MKKATLFMDFYLNNRVFDINDKQVNRDNYAYNYYKLKEVFFQNNYDLSTYDINTIDTSEIIIYSDMPKVLPKNENISKSYLLLFESELIRPDNWDKNKHKSFNKIFTWNDKIIDNEKYFKINFSHLFPININKCLSKKTKLCTLIAGNKEVEHPLELYSKRIEAIKWFEENHLNDFDFYGMGWNKYIPKNRYLRFIVNKFNLSYFLNFLSPNYISYKGKIESKKRILEKYKFAICYENAKNIDGYITEKIFDCFFAGCIPIYWGANNITEHIPKECFIDKRNFLSYEELYIFINNISDKKYNEYLNNIEKYLFNEISYEYTVEHFANTIVNTILKDK
jgi:hypothetical protein